MLLLLFHVGEDVYAIESSHVVEIIPRIALRKMHHVPEYVAGIFNYRGTIVPVVDLCHLIQGKPSRPYLSTRIMMVNYTIGEVQSQYLGLIAEKITKTIDQTENDLVESQIKVQSPPYLGGMIMYNKKVIQRIHLEGLFADVQGTYLLLSGDNGEK